MALLICDRLLHSATIEVDNLAETEALGRRLGELLFPGAVVALIGPLGAGKTHFVRAVAEGLQVRNPQAVTSPTFVLIQEYAARLSIFHFDAYRLAGAREFLDLGVNEYYEAGGVCLIEWADRVIDAVPAEHLRIEIEPVDENRRRFRLIAAGEAHRRLLAL
jgi:tRNA threonylcarbamoyladenosine biosynthesis protein TsaE